MLGWLYLRGLPRSHPGLARSLLLWPWRYDLTSRAPCVLTDFCRTTAAGDRFFSQRTMQRVSSASHTGVAYCRPIATCLHTHHDHNFSTPSIQQYPPVTEHVYRLLSTASPSRHSHRRALHAHWFPCTEHWHTHTHASTARCLPVMMDAPRHCPTVGASSHRGPLTVARGQHTERFLMCAHVLRSIAPPCRSVFIADPPLPPLEGNAFTSSHPPDWTRVRLSTIPVGGKHPVPKQPAYVPSSNAAPRMTGFHAPAWSERDNPC